MKLSVNEKIKAIQTAANMMEIEAIVNSTTDTYLNKFASEHKKAPSNISQQKQWIMEGTSFFAKEISQEKILLFSIIPERFYKTVMYRNLYGVVMSNPHC